MTPQEKDMITQLLDRLKQAGGQPKDPEAEALIKEAVQAQPDAPYLLVQTALVQNMSLEGAQARIQELEREVAQAKEAAAAKPTSFLGGLLGGGNRPAPQPAQSMMPRSGGSVPQAGGYAPQPQQPGYAQQPPGYAQPPLQAPAPGGGGSFLRTAAGVAAGVAGGALLYHGLSSMFSGGHGMGAGSQSFLGGGQSANSPWGSPQAGSGDQVSNELTPERDSGNQQDGGQERDSAYQSDDSGSADNYSGSSDSGGDSGGGWDSGGSSSDDY